MLRVYAAPLWGFMFYHDFPGYQRFAPLGLFVCKPQRGVALVETRLEFIQSPSGAQCGNLKGRLCKRLAYNKTSAKKSTDFQYPRERPSKNSTVLKAKSYFAKHLSIL